MLSGIFLLSIHQDYHLSRVSDLFSVLSSNIPSWVSKAIVTWALCALKWKAYCYHTSNMSRATAKSACTPRLLAFRNLFNSRSWRVHTFWSQLYVKTYYIYPTSPSFIGKTFLRYPSESFCWHMRSIMRSLAVFMSVDIQLFWVNQYVKKCCNKPPFLYVLPHMSVFYGAFLYLSFMDKFLQIKLLSQKIWR